MRHATTSTYVLSGIMGGAGAVVGFGLGGPIGAIVGGILSYAVNKRVVMSHEDSYNRYQSFKFKCSNCGHEWTQKLEGNEHPDDASMLIPPF